MTQDEIIEMAMKVGGTVMAVYSPDLVAFAKLVAAKEREECAKVCELQAKQWSDAGCFDVRDFKLCAAAIRARGQA